MQDALPNKPRLHQLIYDSYRFTQAFINTMEEHPLLIYRTALPFTPVETLLYKTFHNKIDSPWLSVGWEKSWSPLICIHEHKQNVHALAFSPDGKNIASLSGEGIRLRDSLTGADIVSRIPLSSGRGTGALTFSPEGAKITSSWRSEPGSDNWEVCVWDTDSKNTFLESLQAGTGVDPYNSVAFSRCSVMYSPDGTIIATCNPEGKIYLWHTASSRPKFAPLNDVGPDSCADLLAFSPDSTRLVSTLQSSICVWNVDNGLMVLGPLVGDPLHNSIDCIAVSSDGGQILSAARGILRDWDAQSGALIRTKKLVTGEHRYRRAASFSSDATLIALGKADGSINVFDTRSCAQVCYIDKQHAPSGLYSLVFSPTSDVIAATFNDLSVRVYNTRIAVEGDLEEQRPRAYPRIKLLSSYPNGNFVVFTARSSEGPAIHVLDASSGSEIYPPILGVYISPVNDVKTVKFLENGLRMAFVSPDGSVRIRQLGSDTQPGDTLVNREGSFMPSLMDISANGERVVVSDCASAWHDGLGAVEIWDTASGNRLIGPIRGPQAQSGSIAFSPDGTRVLSLGSALCVWDAVTGVVIFENDADAIVKAGYSVDGSSIIMHGYDDDISHLDPMTGKQISSLKSFPRITQSSHLDRFAVDSSDRWIKEVETSKRICQLPPTLRSCNETCSSESSIILHTDGEIVVIQLPSSMLDT